MEFHISRQARERYQFDDLLFSFTGNVIIANFVAARVFAQKMNLQRDVVRYPERAVRPAQINAMGLIDEILHYVVAVYREQKDPWATHDALGWLATRVRPERAEALLRRFADEFPPLSVYRGEISAGDFLDGQTDGTSHRAATLEEILMLRLANLNPAFSPFRELFDDVSLSRSTPYPRVMPDLWEFFETRPKFGPDNQNLIDLLRSPALAAPDSLQDQLAYMRDRWGYFLGPYLYRLLSSLDLIAEEDRVIIGGGGPGPSIVYDFSTLDVEVERFSPDRDWMPRVVLMAKNAYVWLDQLSKAYGRSIARLDQIPDDALDLLARRGFTGLWLIGLWERSPASQRIKQMCGNPDAVASAYSVHEYQIAADLGGQAAFENLRSRAAARGLRMGSDMVANHMGIDSRWVDEHPDWFVSVEHSPFPSYSFNGPDLSWNPRVGIFLEDHYYDRSDAAVVFKRVDRWTGREDYIYHGNDGTRMPWNDTAQLNLLRQDVREAVIQTILQVARDFPIIRFDAAMTLAKRHYQRLWFPEPGTGGAIPSRAGHGLTKQQFDGLMPIEFWREVVDRVAVEAPDTLLLAEAFWLMEGYFVRTLGMHRVYNSAFMNMLRDEDNANYRSVMKNTLEFDPQIMRRYVNFMNNPDERTAVDQFGKDDKYFGVCTLLATLPGLPMFGHGQIEGFTEKYGMEFRRAIWDEQPDHALIRRHEREIFPLLHRRHLFADVDNFRLYDFFTAEGHVNEDVFAYSNGVGTERALVVYHNRYAEARGWIRTSVASAVKTGRGDERVLVQSGLGDGLSLHADPDRFCIFRDQTSGLEYIRPNRELFEGGLYVELGAYKYHVFLDFREVVDSIAQPYAQLAAELGGRGVPSIDDALREYVLRPVLRPFAEVLNANQFRRLLEARPTTPGRRPSTVVLDDVERLLVEILDQTRHFVEANGDAPSVARAIVRDLDVVLRLASLRSPNGVPESRICGTATPALLAHLDEDLALWGTLLGWVFTHRLGSIVDGSDSGEISRGWLDELLLGKKVAAVLRDLGVTEAESEQAVTTIKALIACDGWWQKKAREDSRPHQVLRSLLANQDVQQFLHVNRFQGILWFNKESYERLLWWMLVLRVIATMGASESNGRATRDIEAGYAVVARLLDVSEASHYQVERLLSLVRTS